MKKKNRNKEIKWHDNMQMKYKYIEDSTKDWAHCCSSTKT